MKIGVGSVILFALLCPYPMAQQEEQPAIVFACTTEQECRDLIQSSEQRRTALAEQQRTMEAKSENLEAQVQNLISQLELYQTEIIVTNIELSKLKTQQEQLHTNIDKNKEVMKERLVTNQFSLETNQELTFIANSTSITDFIERMQIINDLSETDNELIQTLTEQIEQLKKNEEKQVAHLNEVNKLTAEVADLKATKKAELDQYLAEIQQKVSEQQNQANQSALSEQKLKELAEAQNLAEKVAVAATQTVQQPTGTTTAPSQPTITPSQPTTTPSQPTTPPSQPVTQPQTPAVTPPTPQPTPSTPASGNVITTAKKYLGVPYVWGGTTPKGFDCSGFTSYVYREATGKNIGRVTTNQENAGVIIATSAAQPGDLLFWGARGSTYHVAIYLGNNQYIHAPYSGRNVEISDFKYYRPDFALRVN